MPFGKDDETLKVRMIKITPFTRGEKKMIPTLFKHIAYLLVLCAIIGREGSVTGREGAHASHIWHCICYNL